jgi:hypothetical protein
VEAKAFDKFFLFAKYIYVFSLLRGVMQFLGQVAKCVDGGYLVE